MNPAVKELIGEYKKRRSEIKKRLKEFRRLRESGDKRIFSELSFCLLTPQTKAISCAAAVKELENSGLLFKGCVRAIRSRLKRAVRFHNKKAQYVVAARRLFWKGKNLRVKERIDTGDAIKAREWLVNNIKGLGYKEASHFLRNIGLGKDIAILDRHILKNLKRYDVISRIPPSIGGRKMYLEVEGRMRDFSKDVGIPLEELDLLFWSIQTGFVFK